MNTLAQFFSDLGLSSDFSSILVTISMLLILAVGAFVVHLITKSILIRGIEKLILKTKATWDNIFLKNNVFTKITHFAPLLFLDICLPIVFKENPLLLLRLNSFILVILIILSVKLFNSVINSAYEIYLSQDISKEIPIKGFIQVLKIANYFIAGILFISVVIEKSPFFLLSGLGALTAVLLFVFKDVLLGLIAGIQLTANKMIRYGDWIEMPKYGADGEVLDVSLTTVKVTNWDKTITTIPTYSLISESFKNWRGMTEAGGRRIKRSVLIDINSVSFCSNELIERLNSVSYLNDQIKSKITEIDLHNRNENIDLNDIVNGRRLTNIGVFRMYIIECLKRNNHIRQDMPFIIRQLPANADGLPLEIYVFANETSWAAFEDIQSDIFDHLYAVIKEFDLKLFQKTTGNDFKEFIAGK